MHNVQMARHQPFMQLDHWVHGYPSPCCPCMVAGTANEVDGRVVHGLTVETEMD